MAETGRQLLGAFPSTSWTLIERVGKGDREALGELLRLYLPAMKVHLVVRKGVSAHDAEDLVQGFSTDKFVEGDLVARVSRRAGRFRNYLLTALDHYYIDDRRGNRWPAGVGGDPPAAISEKTADGDDPSDAFVREWARTVLAQALGRMRAECDERGQQVIWSVFEARVLRPITENVRPPEYQDLVGQFGFASPTEASNALITGKRKFERCLRSIVGDYAAPEEIDDEIRDLWRILSDGRA